MQSISEEEFHRMQIQIIEMRTENYQLKDENRKITIRLKELSEREVKLDKELNKQVKMKRALSTLNKSKQAQEYESLLQHTEEEFALQNQTLMSELSKLSLQVDKLENENQHLKSGNAATSSESEAGLLRLQAENTAMKNTIKNLELKNKEQLEERLQRNHETSHRNTSESEGGTTSIEDDSSVDASYVTTASAVGESTSDGEKFLHLQAQCERLKEQVQEHEELKVKFSIEEEEKILLQKALEEEKNRHMREHRALENEVEAFRKQLDQKQRTPEHNSPKEHNSPQKAGNEVKLEKEIAALKNALQNAHSIIEKHQAHTEGLQARLYSLEETRSSVVAENGKLKTLLHASQQREKTREQEKFDRHSQQRSHTEQLRQLQNKLDQASMERDDAVTKFEESARASGALLHQVDEMELTNEKLRHSLEEMRVLAEKRKKVMDEQAVESQEANTKHNEQVKIMKEEYEATIKQTKNANAEKIKLLENTCKKQEQELIRINHQDRAKTRELDGCQQKVRDMEAAMTSLESSRGWFERALRDAEEAATAKEEEREKRIEEVRMERQKEFDAIKAQLLEKDDVIAEWRLRVDETRQDASKRDDTIDQLKQEITDEINKQKLIEKKGQATMKDLKRQLTSERKRNGKLQEKLKELSSMDLSVDELLSTREDKDGDGSSTSSFSFRDLLPIKTNQSDSGSQGGSGVGGTSRRSIHSNHSPNVNKGETRELLSRITTLQQEKWHLEEQVKHLEESAGAMADELLDKSKMLQEYIQHTRTDHHKTRTSLEELGGSSRKFSDRMKQIITGQSDNDVNNIRELNRKLTRMLEEEMTKNMALKQDLSHLSEQLSSKN